MVLYICNNTQLLCPFYFMPERPHKNQRGFFPVPVGPMPCNTEETRGFQHWTPAEMRGQRAGVGEDARVLAEHGKIKTNKGMHYMFRNLPNI